MPIHLSEAELLAGLDRVKQAPQDDGVLELIVTRAREDERTLADRCEVSFRLGVHGDNWADHCWRTLPDGSPHPDVQVAIINSRCIALLAQEKSRWPLAGDNLYVDLDLSRDNLSAGQRLAIGSALFEITGEEHNGCSKFAGRYGRDALKFVNSPTGKQLRLRGIYAIVVKDGSIKVGDRIKKV